MLKKLKLTTAQTAVLMAVLTVGGKLLGFIREQVMASSYGTAMVADAYVMAQTIPNAVLAGVISAAAISYMPIFSQKIEKEGLDGGNRFTSQLINLLLIISTIAFVAGSVFAKPLVGLLAGGFEGEQVSLTAFYMRGAFFSIIFNAVVVILEAFLQYRSVFLPQLLLSYVQNISIIVFILISARGDYHILIAGLIVGYLLRALGILVISRKHGFAYKPDFTFGAAVKEAAVLAVPVFIGGSVNQINTLVDKGLASWLEEGSVSALNYGNLIIGVITALTVTILVTVLYPRMNKAFAAGDKERIGDIAERSINLMVLISVPFTFGCMVFSKPAIQVIYERGAFGAASTNLTSSAFFYYAIGITFIAVAQIITKIFYSMHDTKTAVFCSAGSVLVNIVLNLILVKTMKHAGLALATSIAQAVNVVLLYIVFRRKYPEIKLLKSLKKIILIVLFSLISVGAAGIAYRLLADVLSVLPRLVVSGGLAVGLYLLAIYLARFDEWKLLTGLLHRNQNSDQD